MRDNLAAVGWSLTSGQLRRLDEVSRVTPPYPYYPHIGMGSSRNVIRLRCRPNQSKRDEVSETVGRSVRRIWEGARKGSSVGGDRSMRLPMGSGEEFYQSG